MKDNDKSTAGMRMTRLGVTWKLALVVFLLMSVFVGGVLMYMRLGPRGRSSARKSQRSSESRSSAKGGAVDVAGSSGMRDYLHGRQAKAAAALANSNTLEELTQAVAEYGSSDVGTGLKLRLAKLHYDARHYQEALDLYAAVLKDADKDDPFLDIAELGRAHALEGLKNYAEASAAFSAYASSEAKTHDGFRLTAQLGAARCKALQGDVEGAVSDLKSLKETTADETGQARIEDLLTLLKYYDFGRQDPDPNDALTLSEDDAGSTPAQQPLPPEEPAAN